MRNYLTNKVISAVKANVPKTVIEKAKSKLNKAIQATKGSKAKLKQTLFEIENKQPLTFKGAKQKTLSNNEKAKIRNEESKKDGGRMGLKFGGGADMGSKKLSAKQMKIASLAGNKKKIDAPDFAKLRGKKS